MCRGVGPVNNRPFNVRGVCVQRSIGQLAVTLSVSLSVCVLMEGALSLSSILQYCLREYQCEILCPQSGEPQHRDFWWYLELNLQHEGALPKNQKTMCFFFWSKNQKTLSVFWLSGTAPQSWSGKPKNTKRFLVFWSKNQKKLDIFCFFWLGPTVLEWKTKKTARKQKNTNTTKKQTGKKELQPQENQKTLHVVWFFREIRTQKTKNHWFRPCQAASPIQHKGALPKNQKN